MSFGYTKPSLNVLVFLFWNLCNIITHSVISSCLGKRKPIPMPNQHPAPRLLSFLFVTHYITQFLINVSLQLVYTVSNCFLQCHVKRKVSLGVHYDVLLQASHAIQSLPGGISYLLVLSTKQGTGFADKSPASQTHTYCDINLKKKKRTR